MEEIKNVINWEKNKDEEFHFDNKQYVPNSEKEFLFSAVIAVYNSEDYVEETIESIINQDLGFDKIQVVLVDDGSQDNSLAICAKYAEKYPENFVVVHKENGGVSSARNVGMKYATGKYINFIDSDDIWGRDVFRKVLNMFKANESKIDVVTVKNELFGLKKGTSWFNKKFDKGDRVISLWQEPKIYLNSTNCSFFHSRIKNQLVFDEQLSIAEDLKVVNTVLMNKWAIGLLASGRYYYRIRSAQDGSLASSARNKACWYMTYLDRVADWLFNKAQKQCGFIPEFLQHTLLRDLFNRFDNNTQCEQVLGTKEEIEEYKEKLLKMLDFIDDKIIKSSDYINTDYQIYFFTKKYGRPTISTENNNVKFSWNDGSLVVSKQLCVMWERSYVKDKALFLEGYVICNNFDFKHENINLHFTFNGKECEVKTYENTELNDKLAFADEYIFYRKYFVVKLDNVNKIENQIFVKYSICKDKYPVNYNAFGKWFGMSTDVENSYFYDKGICLYSKNKQLFVRNISKFEKGKFERRYLKHLKTMGKTNVEYAKGYKIRKLHNVLKAFKIRPIWIISDRNISAGDNGEAFYGYARKRKYINTYFAIRKNDEYKRLKKKWFKLLKIDSFKYKAKWLISDYIVSAHLDSAELAPIGFKFIRDIVAKKKIVFLQHGIIKDDLSMYYSRKIQNLDMFVTSTKPEYNSIVENVNYFCDKDVTKLTGLPRFDKLKNKEEKIILVMPTWRKDLVTFNNRVTITDNFTDSYFYKFYSELLSNKKLHDMANKYGYKIVFFIHSNLIEANKYFEGIKDVVIPTEKERSYNQMFAKASVMITDYSSTAFDFAYLRKPVIYCQGDEQEFFAQHTYSKGYFDYKEDGFGDVVETVDETVEAVASLLENSCQLPVKYETRINNTFPFNDKKNCERVFKEIKRLKKD